MSDFPLVFRCEDDELVGVLSAPERPNGHAVLVIVGGPQYRIGSHRHFLQLARCLVAEGYAVLRFDTRGMGDSSGEPHNLWHISPDIRSAIDALYERLPDLQGVSLWGLCGGASAALLYWRAFRDPRLKGMVLVNPWVRTDELQARTTLKYYYVQRLGERAFWLKLLSGRVALKAVAELWASIRIALGGMSRRVGGTAPGDPVAPTDLQGRMAQALLGFDGPVLVLLSGNDYTAKEFIEATQIDSSWQQALDRRNVVQQHIEEADHTFSQSLARQRAEQITIAWLDSRFRQA